MRGQTVILRGDSQRHFAKQLIDSVPTDAVVNIQERKRTISQNDKMWSMLSDVSRAKPEGRTHTTEVWKAIFMQACGHEVQFINGINGDPFPIGFRSSAMTVGEMKELIECIYEYGARHNVRWNEPIAMELAT